MTDSVPQRRRCPGCKYDMSAVPGLLCPECGQTWVEEQLVVRPSVEEGWPANWLLICVVFVAMGSQWSDEPTIILLVIALAWGTALSWVWLRRASIVSDKPWLLWWLVYLTVGTSEASSRDGSLEWLDLAPPIMLAGVIIFGLLVSPRRFLVGTGVAALWITMLIGVVSIIAVIANVSMGNDSGRYELSGLSMESTAGHLYMLAIGLGLTILSAGGLLWVWRARRPRPVSTP